MCGICEAAIQIHIRKRKTGVYFSSFLIEKQLFSIFKCEKIFCSSKHVVCTSYKKKKTMNRYKKVNECSGLIILLDLFVYLQTFVRSSSGYKGRTVRFLILYS